MKIFNVRTLLVIVGILIAISLIYILNGRSNTSLFDDEIFSNAEEIRTLGGLCVPSKLIDKDILGLSISSWNDERTPEKLSELGINWVRVDFLWHLIEYEKDNFEWDAYDEFVDEMNKRDIKILGIINKPPDWIGDWVTFYKEFSEFLNELVARYPNIKYWEIFNEPNLSGFGWATDGKNPANFIDEYATALIEANLVIKEKSPTSFIIMGGLSPEGYSYTDFLDSIYSFNMKNCFDAIGMHPYGKVSDFRVITDNIKSISDRYGDIGKPIWFTEFGIGNEEERDIEMTNVFREKSVADAFFWFRFHDGAKDDDFGLLNPDFSEKNSYDTFKSLLNN